MQPPVGPLPNCLPQIRRALSDARLDAYRISPQETELDLLARYAWNMALSSALYGPIQLLEVALRNSLHAALTHHYGGNPYWYRLPHAFSPRVFGQKSDPRPEVSRALARVGQVTQPLAADEPGRLVAELNFGFWTLLLTRPYGQQGLPLQPWVPFWPALIPMGFPYLPNQRGTIRDREVVAERFNNIRQFRNRIAHHEPIWRGRPVPNQGVIVPVSDQYQEILEAIRWISPETADATALLSSFDHVYNAGPSTYATILSALP